MKIDTQGMSGPADPNFKGRPLDEQQRDLPKATFTPRRLFTETYVTVSYTHLTLPTKA